MNKKPFAVLALAMAAVCSTACEALADVDAAAQHAEAAAVQLFGASSSEATARAGVLSILDAVAAAAPDAGMTDEWKTAIVGARRRISESSTTDAGAQLALHRCYRDINAGGPFRMQEGIRNVDDATVAGRRLVESAPELLRSGKVNEALRALLETVLMVMTPIEQGEAQSRPNFSGEWTLNKEKTKVELLTLERLEAGLLQIEHDEPMFRLHRVFTVAGSETEFTYEQTTDGREVTRQDGARKLVSKLYWDGDALVYHTRIVGPAGEARNVVTYRLHDGGRVLEADEVRDGPDLKYHNTWIFEVRPPS